jgi:hypothetical protein
MKLPPFNKGCLGLKEGNHVPGEALAHGLVVHDHRDYPVSILEVSNLGQRQKARVIPWWELVLSFNVEILNDDILDKARDHVQWGELRNGVAVFLTMFSALVTTKPVFLVKGLGTLRAGIGGWHNLFLFFEISLILFFNLRTGDLTDIAQVPVIGSIMSVTVLRKTTSFCSESSPHLASIFFLLIYLYL